MKTPLYRLLKRSLAAIAGSRLIRPLFSPFLKGRAVVFMLHRFGDVEGTVVGPSPAELRAMLATVRRHGIPILTLRELMERSTDGDDEVEGVVFTVDDGYHDFLELAAPVFREMECPVTVFLPTGFVDGLYWFWWDKIGYALARTSARRITVPVLQSDLDLGSDAARDAARSIIEEAGKTLPQDDRDRMIGAVLEQLHVLVPGQPPDAYRPLSWPDVRSLADTGVEFGPHSVHHPSFASLDMVDVRSEVRESYDRLRQELTDPVPIFCYPYGLSAHVSSDAARAVQSAGMIAAVTARPSYVDRQSLADPFLLPRFALSHDETEFRQILSGVDRLKSLVRDWAGR